MHILHLAYEDPAQPGSGGGSIRTREINRRLAGRHTITALVANYPGAQQRTEDGIHWVPIGPATGSKLDRLAYFAAIGPALRRHPAELVVEDFGAPFSVAGAPLFTRTPVVASVQWLFAMQMREKYHLPFDWVERAGLRLYHDFVVVSEWLADEVRLLRPNATVEAIPNGVEPIAFGVQPTPPKHLLFVGRLDTQQKGCDLLLESMVQVHATLGERTPPLLIAGDGPDRAAIEALSHRLGLASHVTFLGRVDGRSKYELMAGAYAVLMPSRFETFGMVAAEAQAAGAPVVAYDVGPLREVAGPGGARLVPPFDTAAFARAIVALVLRPEELESLRRAGRRWARRYDWDALAARQEAHYEAALAGALRPLRATQP
jgi:glycosyltransferase involved in cell wall biosynthesis